MTPPMTHHSEPAREAVLDQNRVPTWPAAKLALWHIVTGEKLNDGHYINAYQLTDKLYDAMLSASPAPAAGGLEAVVRYYADTFCELGKHHECCGKLSEDECAGCKATAALASPAATSAETQGGDGVRELLAGLSDFDHMMACHVGIGYFDGTEITKEWDRLVRPAMDRLKSQLAKLSAPLDALEEARASERQTFRDAAAISVWNDALKDALHDLLSRPTDGAARIRARETLTAALAPSTSAATRGEPYAWVRRWAYDGVDVMAFKKADRPAGWQFHDVTKHKIAADDVPLYTSPPAPAVESTQDRISVLLDKIEAEVRGDIRSAQMNGSFRGESVACGKLGVVDRIRASLDLATDAEG